MTINSLASYVRCPNIFPTIIDETARWQNSCVSWWLVKQKVFKSFRTIISKNKKENSKQNEGFRSTINFCHCIVQVAWNSTTLHCCVFKKRKDSFQVPISITECCVDKVILALLFHWKDDQLFWSLLVVGNTKTSISMIIRLTSEIRLLILNWLECISIGF